MGDFEQMRFLTRAVLREKEMLFGAVCVGKNILHKKSIFGRFCRKRIFYKGFCTKKTILRPSNRKRFFMRAILREKEGFLTRGFLIWAILDKKSDFQYE